MKKLIWSILLLGTLNTYAEVPCDLKVGVTIGIPVVEFVTGNVIHSKMNLKEGTALALKEELINLQDEGICTEEIPHKKCTLKFEKAKSTTVVLYRGADKWQKWDIKSKKLAQEFVMSLKKVGFCS